MISSDGNAFLAHFDLDQTIVEPAVAQLLAQPLARAAASPRAPGRDLRRAQTAAAAAADRARRSSAFCCALTRTCSICSSRTIADGDLDEIADHRLDVAADVADLGELRGFDLEERRLRQLGEPPRDLGLADAGRPDHQDVLRRHFLGELGRAASGAACGCAARSPRRAWPLLADDVLVELGDDFARGQRVDGRRGAFWKFDHSGSEFFDRDRRVRIDADLGGDRHRLLRRSRARRARCGAPAPWPRPAQRRRPIRFR